MKRASQNHGLQIAFVAGNIMFFVLSYGIPLLVRSYEPKNYVALRTLAPWIVALWLCLFGAFDLFRLRFQNQSDGFIGIVLSSMFLVIFTFAISFFVREFAVPRSLIGGGFLLQIALFSGWRALFLRLSKVVMAGSRALLIYGDGEDRFRSKAKELLMIAGFEVSEEEYSSMAGHDDQISRSDVFDAILVTASVPEAARDDLLTRVAARGISVYEIPSIADILRKSGTVHVIGDTPVLEVCGLQTTAVERVAKRFGDVVCAAILLVLVTPLIGFAALLTLLDTGRPVLFFQDRLGLDGRRFKIVKLRTMVVDAERNTGPVLAAKDDPRITRSGRFLRKTHIDELPQLWNVLRGDMSLVGPRPERPEIAGQVGQTLPSFDLRLRVKPGLTGLAQTKGTYSTSFEDKLTLDIWYTRCRSFIAADLSVLLNTLRAILTPWRAR